MSGPLYWSRFPDRRLTDEELGRARAFKLRYAAGTALKCETNDPGAYRLAFVRWLAERGRIGEGKSCGS